MSKSKSTFYALKRSVNGTHFFPVEGDLIVIGGYKFGIYMSWITENFQPRKRWYVVELESGVSIGSAETKKGAQIAAKRNFDGIHPTLFSNKISDAIKRYGKSPMYQEGLNLDA